MGSLLLISIVILVALIAVAAVKPEWVIRAAALLVTAGAAVAGWLNSDFIQGLF